MILNSLGNKQERLNFVPKSVWSSWKRLLQEEHKYSKK